MNIHPSTHSPIHIHDHSFWVVMTSGASCSCTMHVHDMNSHRAENCSTDGSLLICRLLAGPKATQQRQLFHKMKDPHGRTAKPLVNKLVPRAWLPSGTLQVLKFTHEYIISVCYSLPLEKALGRYK